MSEFTFYPGCSTKASADHYLTSLMAVAAKLDIQLNELEDWNCCSASIGYVGGGELSRSVLSARNLALAEKIGNDVVTPCAACHLSLHGHNVNLQQDADLKAKANQALAEGDMEYKGSLKVRHIVEVLVNDVGMDGIKAKVTKPLTGIRMAGYVGCQTARPFGDFDSFESPVFLDQIIEATGATATPFPPKTNCCGGALVISNPDLTYRLIKELLESAVENGAEMIVTPCPMCQMNVEMFQQEVNKMFGTSFEVPVLFYSQIMAVAFGLSAEEAALKQNFTAPESLMKIAG